MKPDIPDEIIRLAEHRAARCRVLGNHQRVLILWLLAEQKRTVSEIAQATGISLVSASHHLRILKYNSLVESQRDSYSVYYYVTENELTCKCPVLANKPGKILPDVNQVSSNPS